jgi:ribosomal protein S18 acetylase RimI-like enzyme
LVLHVEVANDAGQELVDAVQRLVPQLSGSAPVPTDEDLRQIVSADATALLVARDGAGGPILGVLTLVTFRIPTGVRAWVEDVVVDAAARGQGVGEALTKAALDLAGAKGAQTVDLTSRPSREAANRLYQRVGFQLRETNVYRFTLGR